MTRSTAFAAAAVRQGAIGEAVKIKLLALGRSASMNSFGPCLLYTSQGKELRLRQQYFFISATVQRVIARFKKKHTDFNELPDKVAFQLNDTHPSMAVAELMLSLIHI